MTTPESSIPIEVTEMAAAPQNVAVEAQAPSGLDSVAPNVLVSYVTDWRKQLNNARHDQKNLWTECWQLYRGVEDWSDKDAWMSKINLPKPWATVKQAVSTIRRLLSSAKDPWNLEPYNPDDLPLQTRSEKMTRVTKVMLEKADYLNSFAEGLESGFIMGLGVWKVWWGLTSRMSTKVVPMPLQNPIAGESPGMTYMPQGKQVVQQEILEGRLFVKAVDPYKFWWLPGSRLNQWVGTLEEIEMPKWKLIEMAEAGIFDIEAVKRLMPMKTDESDNQSMLRFNQRITNPTGPSSDTGMIKLLEYYGPVIHEGRILERNAHIIVANDKELLIKQPNQFWHRRAPYVGFTPLSVPFRVEGVGLIEMSRAINKALSKLANMSVDTLMFKLAPLMEVNLEAYENPEDLETGIVPGKLLRRNMAFPSNGPAITPVPFEDISQGSIAVAAQLDRAAQEGSLVSEIQQALPRYRGVQTAAEIETKQANQDSFFGDMASNIEQSALKPIIEMANDLVFQFIDTTADPRISSILGYDAQILQGIPKEELMEMIAGDYVIKVSGITDQLEKAEMLQNLVQFMNIIGQNGEAWLPYLNADALLRRIMEAFRPAIRDIDQIIADPATVQANKAMIQQNQMMPQVLGMIPQMQQQDMQQQQMAQDAAMQQQEMDLRRQEIQAARQSRQGA